MFGILKRNNPLVMVANERGKSGHKLIVELLIFLLVFIIATVFQSVPTIIYVVSMGIIETVSSTGNAAEMISALTEQILSMGDTFSVIMLLSTVIVVGVCIFYCAVIEKRPIKTMGFVKHGGEDYLKGALIGAGLFIAVTLLGIVFGLTGLGGFRFEGVSGSISPIILVFLVGYVFQGMSEEVLCRGYFMISAARKNGITAAVITSSLIFSLLHLTNSDFGLLPALNIFLCGFFMAVYMLRTGSIWGVAAIHTVWNFMQGSIFGFSVSGGSTVSSVFVVSQVGSDILSGGKFGPEGSVIVTAVLLAANVIILYRSRSKKDF